MNKLKMFMVSSLVVAGIVGAGAAQAKITLSDGKDIVEKGSPGKVTLAVANENTLKIDPPANTPIAPRQIEGGKDYSLGLPNYRGYGLNSQQIKNMLAWCDAYNLNDEQIEAVLQAAQKYQIPFRSMRFMLRSIGDQLTGMFPEQIDEAVNSWWKDNDQLYQGYGPQCSPYGGPWTNQGWGSWNGPCWGW
ncbi:MAG: hypothetical protein M0021_14665 [Clostridia bacterium]|nr:hypothetical protein [Clostridia bacterium]